MSVVLVSALNSLGSATVGVTTMAIGMWLLLRVCRVRSPAIRRFAWLLVLLPGVLVWRISIVLPVLPTYQLSGIDFDQASQVHRPIENAIPETSFFIAPKNESRPAPGSWVPGSVCASALVLGAWLLGMTVLAAQAVRSYIIFRKGLPEPLRAEDEWLTELQDVCEELHLTRPVPLHVTQRFGPALYLARGGYRVLVPQDAWKRFSAHQRRAILRHELAHYVRGDLWKSLLARLLLWPQWFNPLAWLAVRQFEEAAEWACDDAALAAEREGAFDYLRALLELGNSDFSASTLQAAVHGGSLQCRVRRLLSPTGKDSIMKKLVFVVAAFALSTGGFLRIRLASAQAPVPSSAGAPAAAGENASSPSALYDSAVNSEDSQRVASASSATPGQEAFIDLNRTFKEVHAIDQRLLALREKVRDFDRECKEQQAVLAALHEELNATSDQERRLRLEKELADGKAKLQSRIAEVRKQFLEAEAAHYHDAFEEVRTATAKYAKQHGIRVVRRSVSRAYAEEKMTDDKVDITDRKAVLDRVNRPVIYFDGPSEIPSDITDAIVQQLNSSKTR